MQDTLELTEEQLDVALSKVCIDFNRESYSRLVKAYELLGTGKLQSSMDQLLMHFTSAVHNTAWNKVYGHAVLSQQLSTPIAGAAESGSSGSVQCKADDLSKRLYSDICGKVASSSLLPCLLDLCRALWNIMDSYKKVVDFHRCSYDKHNKDINITQNESASQEEQVSSVKHNDKVGEEDDDAALMRQYIERKLANGSSRIWQDVQTKVRLLVISSDVSDLTIDQFLKVMDVIHRLALAERTPHPTYA